MLEPTDEDTAISPLPCFATKTLVIKSGTDVPAAKNVKPMTASGILAVSPNSVAHHTIRYEKIAIQIMLPKNVQTKNFRPGTLKL